MTERFRDQLEVIGQVVARSALRPMLQTSTSCHLCSGPGSLWGPGVRDWASSTSESQPTWNITLRPPPWALGIWPTDAPLTPDQGPGTPCDRDTPVCLSIHLWTESWVVSSLWWLLVELLWMFVDKSLCGPMFSFPLSKFLGGERLDSGRYDWTL